MRTLTGLIACYLCVSGSISSRQFGAEWFKGNTHTHTINSDGDSSPDAVVRWYKEHRYNFVVITDHNYLTPVEGLNAVFAAPGKFLVVSGEEVSDRFSDASGRGYSIHLNAVNLNELIPPAGGNSVIETIQNNVDAINATGSVGHINHPNFHWSITFEDLLAVKDYHLYEIYNGHPAVNNNGGGGLPGTEAMWDSLLTRGKLVYGVADDDAHNFKRFSPNDANPGRGWVVVRADTLESGAIADALKRGDFYSSTGVELEDVVVTEKKITIKIGQDRSSTKFTTFFIGKGGTVLKATGDNPAVYDVTGEELYVRARVEDSNGRKAWTQPVFVDKRQ